MNHLKYPAKTKRSAPNGRSLPTTRIDPEAVRAAFAQSSDPNRSRAALLYSHYAIPATALRCERIATARSSIKALEDASPELEYQARLRSPLITLDGRSLFSGEDEF